MVLYLWWRQLDYMNPAQGLKMNQIDLAFAPALEQAQLIRRREVSLLDNICLIDVGSEDLPGGNTECLFLKQLLRGLSESL